MTQTVQAEMSQAASGKEIRSLALQLADVKGAALNFADGQADAYDSDTLATKTNATYDATNDYYSNPGVQTITPTSSANWAGGTSDWSFGSGTATCTTNDNFIYSTQNMSGDFVARFTWTNAISAFGVMLSSDVGSVAPQQTAQSFPAWWWNYHNSGGYNSINDYGSGNIVLTRTGGPTLSPSNPTNYSIRRVGSTLYWYTGDTLTTTFATTSSADMRFFIGQASGGSGNVTNISFDIPGPALNATLVSSPVTALAAPSTAFVTVQANPVDSITLNTDLVAEVSRDGGTTWSTVTLTAGATNASFVNYEGSVDISGQPSGTSMVIRITTANNKEVQVSGHVLRWA